MTPSERAAEKFRAYLTRRSASDPYDLYQYATNILRATDSSRLPDLTLVKLQTPGCPLKDDERCRDLFESRYQYWEEHWEAEARLISLTPIPSWSTIGPGVRHFSHVAPEILTRK